MKTSPAPLTFHTGQVTSKDGTIIGYRQAGNGQGLIILHGGLRSSRHYERMAAALANTYTVTLPDRRGRGLSGPAGEHYNIDKESEDLAAILQHTRARLVFGHSGGGLFALEAALKLPIDKLILYEPAVSINGSLPIAWIPKVEQALTRQDYAGAMVWVIKGLPLNWMSQMPAWALRPLFAFMLRGQEGAEIRELLHTIVHEGKEIEHLDSTYQKYCQIQAKTLLLGGGNSPTFLIDPLSALEDTLPHASQRLLPGLDHTAPDEDAPETVALAVREFLLER